VCRSTLTFLFATIALGACAAAPPAAGPMDHLTAIKGDYFPLRSRATGTRYHIYVKLPESYAASPAKRYPVVYLTDGDTLYPALAPTHLLLTYDDGLPEAIMVGIAYGSFDPALNRRDVDFADPAAGASDKAAAFQRFLKEELLPAVEDRYRTDPKRRILVGQSRGGFFVLYSAFTDPDLFWGRVASNPSFSQGRERLFGAPAQASRSDLRLAVVSGTHNNAEGRLAAVEWFRTMERRSGLPWSLRAESLEGGTHAADIARAYRSSLRWMFGLSGPPQASIPAQP
jgi:hypothetical protein